MSIETRRIVAVLSASMAVVTSVYAQAGPDQPGTTQPSDSQSTTIQQSQLETVIISADRPELNTIPMRSTFSESTITPEAILNITPSPATTVQTLLNTQPSIYATTGATNGMETNIKFRSFS